MKFFASQTHNNAPVQDKILDLITECPRDKKELSTALGIGVGNLSRNLQCLISKGKIKPNLDTKKYEVYGNNNSSS